MHEKFMMWKYYVVKVFIADVTVSIVLNNDTKHDECYVMWFQQLQNKFK